MKNSKPLILVDGSSYLYRAFHAMPSLANSKGFATGAVYGMVNMLRRLIKDYEPEYMAVVFDAKGKTFRDEIYDKYKANRAAMPNELFQQIAPINEIISAYGLPLITIEGVEADDVIGTLAKRAAQQGIHTVISTSDKDFAQLVDDQITLVNTMTGSVLNPATVKEKFGIPPEAIIDYLTLIGDTIDNIPGVPLVGPKTAVKWLQEYGTLDNVIVNAEKIKGKVGENLRSALAQLPLSKTLATIKLDVEVNLGLEDLQRKVPNDIQLIELFKEFEFKTWLSELLEKEPPQQKSQTQYETILTEEQLTEWLTLLSQSQQISFHTQTSSLNYMDAQIIGIAFAIENGRVAYLPLEHQSENGSLQLSLTNVLNQLKTIFENPTIQKVGHDLKHEMEILNNHDIHLQGIAFDTMLLSYIIDSTSTRHALDALALKYLGYRMLPITDIAGKGAKQLSFEKIPLEAATRYAGEQADIALKLHNMLWPRLSQEKGLTHIYQEVELPLLPVLARIEQNGVLIDKQMLMQQTFELEKRLLELEEEVFSVSGQSFNMSSPKQLQEILFDKLKLPVLQKTPTGQASTADAVLQELAAEYQLPKLIIEHRSLCKLITTYTKKLPEQINQRTGRVHTSYNQTGAATGRLSSSDPNLQNIPIRTQEGRRIRQAFIAPPGYKIISADYSQIELRIMAHISDDPHLLQAFAQNLDIHTATAAEVLGLPLDQVSYEERRSAKAINFGLIYGMSAFGLAKQIGVERQAAQTYIDRYFERYPNVKAYMENTRAAAHIKGFVETLSGRRLYLPEINSSQIPRQKAAERAAINGPLQGSAADIIKRAMISLHNWLEHNPIDARLIMQVHDELVFEVADADVEEFKPVICEHMMKAAQLKVPLLVSIGVGSNWDAASGE